MIGLAEDEGLEAGGQGIDVGHAETGIEDEGGQTGFDWETHVAAGSWEVLSRLLKHAFDDDASVLLLGVGEAKPDGRERFVGLDAT